MAESPQHYILSVLFLVVVFFIITFVTQTEKRKRKPHQLFTCDSLFRPHVLLERDGGEHNLYVGKLTPPDFIWSPPFDQLPLHHKQACQRWRQWQQLGVSNCRPEQRLHYFWPVGQATGRAAGWGGGVLGISAVPPEGASQVLTT